MKMKVGIFLAAAIVAANAADASAEPFLRKRTPVVRARQHRQHERIEQGARNGTLTPTEQGQLRLEQKDIRQEKRDARSDGVVTRSERYSLRHEQNQANRNIYNEKHD